MFRKKYTAVPVACRSIPYPVVQEVQEVRWYILHTCMCTQIPYVPVVDTPPVTKKFPRSYKIITYHIYFYKKKSLHFLYFTQSVSGAHVCGTYRYLLHMCTTHSYIQRYTHHVHIMYNVYNISLKDSRDKILPCIYF